jgi:hypothetical protein
MSSTLKLYVWSPALTDYTDGIIFALAESADHARKLVLEHNLEQHAQSLSEEMKRPPQVYHAPVGFAVWGGG